MQFRSKDSISAVFQHQSCMLVIQAYLGGQDVGDLLELLGARTGRVRRGRQVVIIGALLAVGGAVDGSTTMVGGRRLGACGSVAQGHGGGWVALVLGRKGLRARVEFRSHGSHGSEGRARRELCLGALCRDKTVWAWGLSAWSLTFPRTTGLQGAPVGWIAVCDSDDSDGRDDDDDSLVGWCDDGQSSDDGGDGDDGGGEVYRTQSGSR